MATKKGNGERKAGEAVLILAPHLYGLHAKVEADLGDGTVKCRIAEGQYQGFFVAVPADQLVPATAEELKLHPAARAGGDHAAAEARAAAAAAAKE